MRLIVTLRLSERAGLMGDLGVRAESDGEVKLRTARQGRGGEGLWGLVRRGGRREEGRALHPGEKPAKRQWELLNALKKL